VLRDHLAGEAINIILNEGFVIEAMLSFHLSLNMAENLFSVYRNIYSAYVMSLEHICSGPVIALAISNPSSPTRVVQDFREFCGPLEPSLAKLLRPRSLRALFGKDSVRNAVHCTDLPEDGEMESRYFFDTVANL
jgi:nucleoside-diphosphate kinase